MKKYYGYLFSLGLLCALPWNAYALKVGNCDKAAHRVTIDNAGEVSKMTLAPGQEIFMQSPMVSVGVGKRPPVRLDQFYDYCIWHGALEVQYRNRFLRHGHLQN